MALLEAEGYRAVVISGDACTTSLDLRIAVQRHLAVGTIFGFDDDPSGAAHRPTAVLVEDADLCADAITEAIAWLPDLTWILTSPTSAAAERIDSGRTSEALAVDLPPGLELYADIPMGVPPELVSSAASTAFEVRDGRARVPREVRDALGFHPLPSTESLAAVMRDRLEYAEGLAADAWPENNGSLVDLRFFREVAMRVVDPDLAAMAAAAVARLLLREHGPGDGLAMLQRALVERPPSRATATALLRWVEADIHAELGDEEQAEQSRDRAFQVLRGPATAGLARTLCLTSAAAWACRGDGERADRWRRRASAIVGLSKSEVGYHHYLVDGHLAVQRGDLLLAEALFSSAAASAAPKSQLSLGQAMVHLGRGEFSAAEEHLDAAEVSGALSPPATVAVMTLRAESMLRSGRKEGLESLLVHAADKVRLTGSARALSTYNRQCGDWHALCGRRDIAVDKWRLGLRYAARVRDMRLSYRLMRRINAVEAEGTREPSPEDWDGAIDLAAALLRLH